MSNLSELINEYLALCRERLQPLLDRWPWSEIAANPAPEFRAVFAGTERSQEFLAAARAFDEFVSEARGGDEPVFEGAERCRHFWHFKAFVWNAGVYDDLICCRPVHGHQVEEMIGRELARNDVVFRHAAFLESFACPGDVDVGDFQVRHLTDEEVHEVFEGRCRLDRHETESAIRDALKNKWFAVVRGVARPLEDRLVFEGAIGLHDFTMTPFRDINLGLNLFKASAGPVVIRRTFHWNSSVFYRRIREYPQHSDDLFPSTWSGPDDPPPMRLYRLDAGDSQRLPVFWNEFKHTHVENAKFLPSYVHRAIDRFLRACKARRTDWEFCQLLYVMALEALFSGEDDDKVRPTKTILKEGKQVEVSVGVMETIAKCCATLVAPQEAGVVPIREWLFSIYKQRSRLAHASTFEQEEFFAQPQCPDEHTEAISLCNLLGVDTSPVVEGPDMEFAVLHNVVRMSLLFFVGRTAGAVAHGLRTQTNDAPPEQRGSDGAGESGRQEQRDRLEHAHLALKRDVLRQLYDCHQRRDETWRRDLRSSSGLFLRWGG